MKFFLLFALLFTTLASRGQTFFSKTIGDTINQVWITNSIGTSDGGYLLCGRLKNYYNFSRSHAVLLKLDSQGDTSWTTVLSDTNSIFHAAVELPLHQGFICVGNDKICLIDTLGNLIWKKGGYQGPLTSVLISGNGSLLISAEGAVVYKTDFNGNIIWATSLDHLTGYRRRSMLQTSSGDIFIAGGNIDTYGVNPSLYKLDGNGNLIWARTYSFYNYDVNGSFISMDTTYDGKLLLVATYGDAHTWTWNNIEYTKIDTSGTAIWTRFLPQSFPYRSDGKIFLVSENTYGLIGYSESFGFNIYSLTMDSSGIPLSSKLFPITGDELNVTRLNNHQLLFSCSDIYLKTSRLYLLDSLGGSFCDLVDTNAIVVDTTPIYPGGLSPMVTFLFSNNYNLTDSITRGVPFLSDCLLTSSEMTGNKNRQPEIIIYPNPAQNQFAVSSWQLAKGLLEIFNSFGQKIYSAAYSGPSTVIPIAIGSELFPKGIYFVRLSNSENQLTQKLIIE